MSFTQNSSSQYYNSNIQPNVNIGLGMGIQPVSNIHNAPLNDIQQGMSQNIQGMKGQGQLLQGQMQQGFQSQSMHQGHIHGIQGKQGNQGNTQISNIQPLSIIDACINSQIFIIMKDAKEISGTLKAFDDYVNMILENVIEYDFDENGNRIEIKNPKGVLLNGSNIAIMVPGSQGAHYQHETMEWTD